MKHLLVCASLTILTLACNQKSAAEDAATPATLNNRVPSITDGSVPAGVAATASDNAVPAAGPVAGSCQTFDSQGSVSSCVDYQSPAYTATTAQTGCQQINPNNKFTATQPCSRQRASGACLSPEYNTITWLYLLPDENAGSRPAPVCDNGQPSVQP